MKKKSKTDIIQYASVLPGTGKTKWAIDKMVEAAINRKGIMIYVAPTKLLLREVHKALKDLLNPKYHSRIHVVSASLGAMPTHRQVSAILNGGKVGPNMRPPGKPGTIILTTHATFLRLPQTFDTKETNTWNREDIDIIFDEARKCTIGTEHFTFSKSMVTSLQPYMDLVGLPSTVSTYNVLQIKSSLNTATVDAIFSKNKGTRLMRTRLLKLLSAVQSNSVDVYASGTSSTDSFGTLRVNIQTVLVPARLFHGWGSVVLLSAFFEHSQLYHLLREQDVTQRHPGESQKAFAHRRFKTTIFNEGASVIKLENITEQVVNPKRIRQIEKRLASTSIVYITPDKSLSMNHLRNGVMVTAGTQISPKFYKRFEKVLTELPNRKDKTLTLRGAWDAKRGVTSGEYEETPLSQKIIKALDALPDLVEHHTPIQYYVAVALRMSTSWYKTQGTSKKLLPITLNVGHNDEFVNEVLENIEKEKWIQMPFQSHGLNKFQKCDTIAFLATLNPRPEIKNLMAQLAPFYDPDLDHTVDSCVQAATRCSLRNTKSKSNPLIIVTDKILATNVQSHLGGLPKLLGPEDFGIKKVRTPLTIRTPDATRIDRVRRYRQTDRYKIKQDFYRKHDPNYLKISSLANQVSRLKKYDPNNRLEDLQKELASLRAQSTALRKLLRRDMASARLENAIDLENSASLSNKEPHSPKKKIKKTLRATQIC